MEPLIPRPGATSRIEDLLSSFPVVAIVGPRQVGKTTLAMSIAATRDEVHTFDLEDPADLARLADPGLALKPLRGLVIIDEIQLRPQLFGLLRALADRPNRPATFLVLGSASPDLMRGTSQTLAGRIAYHRLTGFDLREVGSDQLTRLWLRGAYPRSFLAPDTRNSAEWRRQFISTFLQRDIPQLGLSIPANRMRRFWTMLAHYHGQTLNASELGRSLGVSDKTIRNYLDLLVSTFVVRELLPWHANVKKRQVKSPKVYIDDSGLLHTLLGLDTRQDVERHPKLGASWEGFALSQVIATLNARNDECYFWATHAGAELDLLVVRGSHKRGFEFKRSEAPRVTRSMRSAIDTLGLDELDVVHAGPKTYPLAENIRALAISDILDLIKPLG